VLLSESGFYPQMVEGITLVQDKKEPDG